MKVLIVAAERHAEEIARNLRAAGMEVEAVYCAEHAERIMPKNPAVDVILCDLYLQSKSGIQFRADNKSKISYRGKRWIAMAAGHGGYDQQRIDNDTKRAKAAGFDHFILRPLDKKLADALRAMV